MNENEKKLADECLVLLTEQCYLGESIMLAMIEYDMFCNRMVECSYIKVKKSCIDKGKFLDIFINDDSAEVRKFVAAKHYKLDILANDKNPDVRYTVAENLNPTNINEFELLKTLSFDDDKYVREAAQMVLLTKLIELTKNDKQEEDKDLFL